MRLTCITCILNLVYLGICGGIYAFCGVNALLFLCLGNLTVMRCVLAVGFVSALFMIYALFVLKPFKGLK